MENPMNFKNNLSNFDFSICQKLKKNSSKHYNNNIYSTNDWRSLANPFDQVN